MLALQKPERLDAIGHALHDIAIGREDLGDERAHAVTGFDHQDERGDRVACLGLDVSLHPPSVRTGDSNGAQRSASGTGR